MRGVVIVRMMVGMFERTRAEIDSDAPRSIIVGAVRHIEDEGHDPIGAGKFCSTEWARDGCSQLRSPRTL